MGKMMLFAVLSVFIIELALTLNGGGVTHTDLYNALTNPLANLAVFGGITGKDIVGGFIFLIAASILILAIASVITPSLLVNINQFALFAIAATALLFFITVFVDFFVFIQGQLTDVGVAFSWIIASLITAPLILMYLFAILEWTRFNQ